MNENLAIAVALQGHLQTQAGLEKIRKETEKLGDSVKKGGKQTRKAGRDQADASKDAKKLEKAYGRVGKAAGGMRRQLKRGVVAVAAITGAVTALTLKGGIGRALNIEDAEAKLAGLGHTAQGTNRIMDSALKSVQGTAYGLDTAATSAATAVAAGVKPGKELTTYLKTVADAATIAGVGMGEMGQILGKVRTEGRAYTTEIRQLADRGLPVWQWLQKELGVTQEALREMVKNGEVDAATFERAIRKNIGGAALESGKTTRGALANTRAAFSRLGALVAGPFLADFKRGLGGTMSRVDALAKRLKPFIDTFVGALGRARKSGARFGFDIAFALDAASGGGKRFRNAFRIVEGVVKGVWRAASNLVLGVRDLAMSFLPAKGNGDGLKSMLGAVWSVLKSLGASVVQVTDWIRDFGKWMRDGSDGAEATKTAIVVLTGAVIAGVAAYKAYMIVTKVVAALKAFKVAAIGGRIAVLGLNLAIAANPIGVAIALLAGLAAGIVIAWKRSERFREIVLGAWSGIKKATRATVDWVKRKWMSFIGLMGDAKSAIAGPVTGAWGKIKSGFGKMIKWIQDKWNKFAGALNKGLAAAGKIPGVPDDLRLPTFGGSGESKPVSAAPAVAGTDQFRPFTAPPRVESGSLAPIIGAAPERARGGGDIVVQIDGREVARAKDTHDKRKKARK